MDSRPLSLAQWLRLEKLASEPQPGGLSRFLHKNGTVPFGPAGRNSLSYMQSTPYLQASEFIDLDHPAVDRKAKELAAGCATDEDVARKCFQFVRDEIKHSWDFKLNPVTYRASDVLIHGTGYCYAKSHLLAALLRANGIPAGLCYQRLSVGGSGSPFSLHGLNAAFLKRHGWDRIDARGNKPGVEAAFAPPVEKLAFPILGQEEADLPEIWPEPLGVVVKALTENDTIEQVYHNLPDIELIRPAFLGRQREPH
jgi:transglutaminase-like putative cysteine protease